MPEEIDFPWLENASFGFGDFVPVFQNSARVRQANNDTGEANEVTVAGNEASDSSDPTSSDSASPHEDCTEASMPKIFSCPEEGQSLKNSTCKSQDGERRLMLTVLFLLLTAVPARLRKSCMQLKVKVSLPSCTWTA